MKAVLLGRVSRGERTQDPETQLDALRGVAARLGHQVVEEIPLKLSGWDDQEAAEVERRALAPIKEGRADLLMVWAWDRFSRGGIADALGLLDRLEKHLGASFYSMQEPFLSTATADPRIRELMLALAAWNAERESGRKSERLKAKAKTKKNRAAALGERATWGRGRLASPAEELRARELRAMGYPLRSIAAELGLSKSQVGRLVEGVPAQTAGQKRARGEKGAPSAGGGLGQPPESGQNIVPVPMTDPTRGGTSERDEAVSDGVSP